MLDMDDELMQNDARSSQTLSNVPNESDEATSPLQSIDTATTTSNIDDSFPCADMSFKF